MSEPDWVLAVDFGTSNTTAAHVSDGGVPAVLQVENSPYLPSVVVADGDGRLVTGKAAVQQAVFFLIPEPVAAAWWYEPPSAGQVVAVFDLGGGTLDTAVLVAVEGRFTPAGPPGGDADLGGEDFDELLLERVKELARDRDAAVWEQTFGGEDLRTRRELLRLRADVRGSLPDTRDEASANGRLLLARAVAQFG